MITAKEAFEKANKISKLKNSTELSRIEKLINTEVANGNTEVTDYCKSYNEKIVKYLTDLGYKVRVIGTGINENSMEISWK